MRLLFVLIALFLHFSLQGGESPKKMYLQALDEQVAVAEQKAAFYLSRMQFSSKASAQFEQANTMLEVKKSLAARFKKSKAIETASVRWMLLEIMKKENIQESDLAALQSHVNEVLGR